jgi:hypothetical protein
MLLVTTFVKWSFFHRLIVPARHSYVKVRKAYFVAELPSLVIIFENSARLTLRRNYTYRAYSGNKFVSMSQEPLQRVVQERAV